MITMIIDISCSMITVIITIIIIIIIIGAMTRRVSTEVTVGRGDLRVLLPSGLYR